MNNNMVVSETSAKLKYISSAVLESLCMAHLKTLCKELLAHLPNQPVVFDAQDVLTITLTLKTGEPYGEPSNPTKN